MLRCFSLSILTFLLCFSNPTLSASPSQQLPEPYASVDPVLPFLDHGWLQHTNKVYLNKLIKENKVEIVIELGSWLGKSAISMAQYLPEHGKLYAVDHWNGSIEHFSDSSLTHILPKLYEQFLSNIIQKKLCHKIIPIRAAGNDAAIRMRGIVIADLIYIDGSHDEISVTKDLNAWYPLLRPGGVFCGDDYYGEGVQTAVHKFADAHPELKLRSAGNCFWWFEPAN